MKIDLDTRMIGPRNTDTIVCPVLRAVNYSEPAIASLSSSELRDACDAGKCIIGIENSSDATFEITVRRIV